MQHSEPKLLKPRTTLSLETRCAFYSGGIDANVVLVPHIIFYRPIIPFYSRKIS